jgi:hypothetical protein
MRIQPITLNQIVFGRNIPQSFRKDIIHWSEIRLDNASIVYKSEAGSNRPPPDSGPHFCIDLYYRR